MNAILVLCMPSPAEAVGEVTLAAIRGKWSERGEEIQSLYFTWTSTNTFAPASLRPAQMSPSGEAVPKEEFTYIDPAVSMWLDGSRIRYEHEQSNYETRMAGQQPSRYISAFDGNISADLTSADSYEYARGIICEESKYNDLGNFNIWPVLLWCRPLRPELLALDSLRLEKGGIRVEDERHLVLLSVANDAAGRVTARIWVDPARDFTIRRYTALDDGRPKVDLDISYTNDPVNGWIPDAWTARTLRPNGTVLTSSEAKVSTYAINRPIPVETFRLAFPPGTVVADRRSKEDYLVLSDGSKRVITKAERMVPFTLDDLKATNTGELAHIPVAAWRSPLLWFNILVIGILVALLFWHRRQHVFSR